MPVKYRNGIFGRKWNVIVRNGNGSLWGACGVANQALFDSARANDPVADVLDYLRAQSRAEVAAMVASAENYGEFQVGWRSEQLSVTETASLYFSAITSDIVWVQKVAEARNQYFAAASEAVNEYNDATLEALAAYNAAMLDAEISRSEALFSASGEYSLQSYENDADYAQKQLESARKYALALLDAQIAEMLTGEKQDVTEIERAANKRYNEDFVEYFFAQLEAEAVYYTEVVAAAMEAYNNEVEEAEEDCLEQMFWAEVAYVSTTDALYDQFVQAVENPGIAGISSFLQNRCATEIFVRQCPCCWKWRYGYCSGHSECQ